MRKNWLICGFVLVLVLGAVDSANILAYFFVPSVSHQYVFQPIWKELSLRGHNVTVITPNPLKDSNLKNLTEIDVSESYNFLKVMDISNTRRETSSTYTIIKTFYTLFKNAIRTQMEQEQVKNILSQPEGSFDLIVIETGNLVGYGLKHKFNAPLISISSLPSSGFTQYTIGNPVHPVLYPDTLTESSGDLSFWQKIDSICVLVTTWLMAKFYILPETNMIGRHYFGEDMPHVEELMRQSVFLENSNPIFSSRRPRVPNMRTFWNVHLNRDTVPPKDLQKILDDAKEGVVYFSLGTNVRFDHVQGNMKEAILEALGELPYVVLCKWESEDYPGKPKNVVLRKWFPQQAILAHPNVKSFVTQGGLQSSEEAIANGVPLVIIPFLGDQPMNAKILTRHGMAETISPKYLEKNILRDTILKVTKEEKYRSRAQELRSIFLDQPQSGIDKVIWWCEYVIRHKGAKHLRSPSADIPLYEYFMLDVFAVIFAALFVIYKMMRLAVRTLMRLLTSGNNKKDTKKKTN